MFQYFWIFVIGVAVGIVFLVVIGDMISTMKETWAERKTIHSLKEFLITYFSYLDFSTKVILGFLLFYLFWLSMVIYHDNHLGLSDIPWRK